MPDLDQNPQNDFMIEKIKKRPVNKKKLLKRTLLTAAMAVVFGLIATLTFLILEPVFSNWLYPEEEPPIIIFPEDQEEMDPGDMLSDNIPPEEEEEDEEDIHEDVILNEEQVLEILSRVTLDINHYNQLYASLSDYTEELRKSMVKITGVTSEIDWFDNIFESKSNSSGVIIDNNGKELLILADYSPLVQSENLTATFYNNVQAEAEMRGFDPNTNIALFYVNVEEVPQEMVEEDFIVSSLGISNSKNLAGKPIVALGSPMGSNDSVGYGIIGSNSGKISGVDANYSLLTTNIFGSQNAGGVLFNMKYEVIGIITTNKTNPDMKNIITAYGISDLKSVINKMTVGEKFAYLGIIGTDVTDIAHEELEVPYGAYVKEVVMDSQAMQSGIQQGDVIVEIGEHPITKYSEYTKILLQMEVGETIHMTVMRQVQEEYKEMDLQIVLGEAK